MRRWAVQEWIGESTDMRMSIRAKKLWFVLIGLHGSEKGEPQIHVEMLQEDFHF